ncbi:MAG: sigma-70 family RNA polymerase sigma factor [Planctomycetia bacterium]|nr:sigma-70 family RNA polymerase sigma factor [Planctomycetia bacterium]
MAHSKTTRSATATEVADGPNDALLLRRFAVEHDQAAFRAVVERHGALVWGVCRRVLRHWQDTEDAWQATFLVLARKAGSVNWSPSVANWLYSVAYRVALKARAEAGRRRERQAEIERQQRQRAKPQAVNQMEFCLDEELHRLPEKYRAPLVLCYLEGKSNEEAARQLGRPVGTVWYQLTRGREMLRERLAQRGLMMSTAGLALALSESTATAAVPSSLVTATLAAVAGGASGHAGNVAAAALAQQVLAGMLFAKVKTAASVGLGAVLAAALVVATGAALQPGEGDAAPASSAQPVAVKPGSGRIVGYYPEWGIYDRKFHVADIPANKLTHLNYAFAKIENGECALFDRFAAVEKQYPGDNPEGKLRGNFRQLQLLKQQHPHLKTLLAVGGWTLSGPFSDAALTDESRAKFARSCGRFVTEYGFDGIDIDWEYPVGGGLEGNKTRPEDKQNYTKLLARLRAELDAVGKADGKTYLLTIAAPAAPATFANVELDKVHPYLDWVNLMSYDFHGSWSDKTNFHAPLFAGPDDPAMEPARSQFNVAAAVQGYLKAGVPADKLVMGVPFYGRGWGGVKDANKGLYQPHAPQVPRGTWEDGVWDYKDLTANYVGKLDRHWHDAAKAPWLFDPKKGLMITYEDPESLRHKVDYVRRHGLGGVMIWEVSADDPRTPLLDVIQDSLKRR